MRRLGVGTGRRLRGYGGRGNALVNCALASLLALVVLTAPARSATPWILAFGDSLTAGFGLGPQEAFPVRLQARLAADGVAAQITNAGVSGDTTAGGLARIDWALGDKPGYALVELGANDALRGLDPQAAYANLDQILARLRAAGVKVLLLGMRAPANWGHNYQQEFDAIYPRLAAKWQVPLYPFFLDGVALDPSLNQGDGLHPNARGVEVIVAHVAPLLERLLAQGAGAS